MRQISSTLLLTEGKVDDVIEEYADDEIDEKKSKEEEAIKKKGKVIITKPAKSSTIVFIRRTSRNKLKLSEQVQDIVFKWPQPTFQEKLKGIDSRVGMENFKSLRYESINAKEKKQVEDMTMSKLGKWKYSPDQLAQQILNELMERIQPR